MSFTPEEEAELRILLGITNKTVSDLELAPTLAGDMLMEVESGSGTFSSSINNLKTFIAPPASLTVNGIQTLKSNRNAIINGDFNVWQRGTSFTSVVAAAYTADRWQYGKNGAMVHDITLSSDVPTVAQAGRLFSNSLKIDCQTVDSSIGSAEYSMLSHNIEGFNFRPLAQRAITLSFWVKATKTGTYCVAFRNGGADRSYVAEYTINASNTWEFKTITILPSPASGAWDYTNSRGLSVDFALATGTTFQTTPNAWQTGNFLGSSNQVNACDSTSNDFFIAGVQLEAGSVATPFENRTIQQELSLCQRYYEYGIAFALAFASGGSITQKALFPFKTVKRTSSPSSSLSVISGGATSPVQASINAYSLWLSYGASGAGIEGQFNVIINDEL